ncbi:multidrug resistance-associated ABC transporter [Crepidotus variabilis]|uniref:Multidrug resistance-associated ABC transporter n=1 Tax=Crepidotus variabilis TaxID=179855 RepID=A0A9P6JPT5_9AGAR|nr:multidrug resistance-associated ABC transporter [Crepidotus variabilis]
MVHPTRFTLQAEHGLTHPAFNYVPSLLGSGRYHHIIGPQAPNAFEVDTRFIPFAVAVFTCTALILQALVHRVSTWLKPRERNEELNLYPATRQQALLDKYMNHVQRLGGSIIYAYSILRFSCVMALLYLSAAATQKCVMKAPTSDHSWPSRCPEIFIFLTYVYSAVLSFLVLFTQSWRVALTRANTFVLLSAFSVYVHRDIWPLATYTDLPIDIAEGNELYIKIAILFIVALCIPLCIPRPYIPVDPLNPMLKPNPELTASWLSRMTFSYIDSVIRLGSSVSHLSHEQLPLLGDADSAVHQKKGSFQYMDPFGVKKRSHLFWGALIHFRKEFSVMFVAATLMCLLEFVAPIGINQVLRYLERGNTYGNLRPWFWIAWLFCGPVLTSFATHWYIFHCTVVSVRMEAIITQLVFEHSLRIRMKAEATNDEQSQAELNATKSASLATPTRSASTATFVVNTDGNEEPGNDRLEEDIRSESGSSLSESTAVGSPRLPSESTGTEARHEGSKESSPKNRHSGDNLLGKINNYVTSDLQHLVEGVDFLTFVLNVPLQIAIATIFLYQLLGWSALVGLVITVIFSPIAGVLGKKVQDLQVEKMKTTDARVQTLTEAVGVLRMIKLFGWEAKMAKQIEEKRDDELGWLWKVKRFRLYCSTASLAIPTVTMLITYISYTLLMKEELTASTIFSSMAVFSILREQLYRISWQTMLMIEAKVSLDRVSNFLQNAELLDTFEELKDHPEKMNLTTPTTPEEDTRIGFGNATFGWSLDEQDGRLSPSSRNYRLHIDGDLLFKRGKINLIIGPTGCGKTSMLMALLGEMHFIPANLDSWFSLPRGGGVAYAAQESWLQSATIRDNILFGSPYEEGRYEKVIAQCALQRDLELFEAGDATEVGERGLTLSGGQKARVTLARAIYSSAQIILLDDILAALDVHTSAWIVDNCLKGDLVTGRTILLVTHNIALAGPVADFVVSLTPDGTVSRQGMDLVDQFTFKLDSTPAIEDHDGAMCVVSPERRPSAPNIVAGGKLIVAEEIVQGHVSWKSMKLLLEGLGGKRPTSFAVLWCLSLLILSISKTVEPWFLGVWGSQYETHPASEVDTVFYIAVFSAIAILNVLAYTILNYFYKWRTILASRHIHKKLVQSVFGATLRWLDETPAARITTRCTQDIRIVDILLPNNLWWVVETTLAMIARLVVIVIVTPVFLFPGLAVAAIGWFVGQIYLKTQLCIKREMSNARSPLLAHFNAAIHGIVSIRAYGAQESFINESLKRVDFYCRAARTSWNLNRWIGIRMDLIGAVFTSSLAAYLVYGPQVSAANTGVSLNMAASFTMFIFWLIRIYNELEVQSNSLERIQAYVEIEHEVQPIESRRPPAAWPTSGDLRVENLSARYSQNGPRVLHGINFNVKSGERIGVVGRTGSGKSSLTLAILRCIITEGTVYLDGLPTNTINLDSLRSNITIIPQMPELISGTLRQNLDPFEQNDDATLNDAVSSAGLFALQDMAGEARITLDTKIAGGGSNLSVGQRQIIALARAMVRGSKLLILDEATSAIDYNTDAIIQRTLRTRLGKDTTVITIAHRLHTIMDADKILVLDGGRIVEFDSPQVLLKNEGLLKALVDASGDSNTLRTLAGCD